MKQKTITEKVSGLKMHKCTLDCGLDVSLIPMKGFNTSGAFFYTKFGGMDLRFKDTSTGNYVNLPEGTAHFFEHKLFDMPDGSDVFDEFHKNGAYANAFTSYDKTNYLFFGPSNFKKNLEILLDYVLTPYFTKESIEKEQGIIGAEIERSNDSVERALMENLFNALYRKNNIKSSIIGTRESISEITEGLLYTIHKKFYHPSNMGLVITGDKTKRVFKYVDDVMNEKGLIYQEPPKVEYPEETDEISKKRIEIYKDIPMSKYLIGFKNNINVNDNPKEVFKNNLICDLLLSSIFGDFSDIYYDLYSKGVINETFSTTYYEGRGFGLSMIAGTAEDVEPIEKKLVEELKKVHMKGVPEQSFNRLKNIFVGQFLQVFNNPQAMANQFLHYDIYGASVFDYIPMIQKITIEDANKMFRKHINLDNYSLAIVKPKK